MALTERAKEFHRKEKDKFLIPGTYQIRISRVEEDGEEEFFTCYVPIHPKGLKELLRRRFLGVSLGKKKPEYFMAKEELRRF